MKLKILIMCLSLLGISLLTQACYDGKAEYSLKNSVIDVEVEKIKSIDGNEIFAYSGTIEESESISLSFSVVGSVSRVLVSPGDFVKKGQLLAEINSETYKNVYEVSFSAEKQAEDAYNRLLPMFKNGNLPEIKLVEVETGLQQAKSATAISKKNVEDCKLYSPIDGIVGKRSMESGMSAIPNLTSINIVKIEKVFATVPVSENEISSINKGQKANITIAALSNSEFTGVVEEIGVLAEPLTHSYKIKIGISNIKRKIKPGMICEVSINKNNNTGLSVPSRAVMVDEIGRNFVYAVNQNKSVRKYVTTGRLLKKGVEITSGLNEDELIVVAGHQKLVDNSLIHIVNR